MRYLAWLFKIALFLALLSFALKNAEPVAVRYYLGYEWQAPLVLVLLIFFALGVAVGILASFGYTFRRRGELRALRRELKRRPTPASDTPDGI